MRAFYSFLYYFSLFRDIEYVNYFLKLDSIFITMFRLMGTTLTRCLGLLLGASMSLVQGAWNFLFAFSNNSFIKGLTDTVNGWIWIPVAICLLLFFIKLLIGRYSKGDANTLISNILVLALVVTVLPTVLAGVNNILQTNLEPVASTDALLGEILYSNTTDYEYVYDKYIDKQISVTEDKSYKTIMQEFLKNKKCRKVLERAVDTSGKIGNETFFFTGSYTLDDKNPYYNKYIKGHNKDKDKILALAFNTFDPFTTIDLSEDQEHADFFNYVKDPKSPLNDIALRMFISGDKGIINANESKMEELITERSTGFLNMPIGVDEFYKEKTDYLVVVLEILAWLIVYLSMAYGIIKIAWELVIHKIFIGTLAAVDLTGGEKIKKALTHILGLYICFFFITLIPQLFSVAHTVIKDLGITGLPYCLILLFLAFVTMDTPNIVGKYFDVNIPMKGGIGLITGAMGAGMMASRLASSVSRIVKSPSKMFNNSKNFTRGFGSNGAGGVNGTVDGVDTVGRNKSNTNNGNMPNADGNNSSTDMPTTGVIGSSNAPDDNAAEYLKRAKEEYPDMSPRDQRNAADYMRAQEQKGRIYEDAFGRNVTAEANGGSLDNKEALRRSLNNKGYNNQYGLLDGLEDRGAYQEYVNNGGYANIAQKAKNIQKSNSNKHYNQPTQPYIDAAKSTGITNDKAAAYAGSMAYIYDNRGNIRKEVSAYQRQTGCNRKEAISYVIKNNPNGHCGGQIKDKAVADKMVDRIYQNGWLRPENNKGKSAFN